MYEGQAYKTQESDNLKRAMDDLKYQQEESLRIINLKDQEILYLQKDLSQLRELLDRGQEEHEGLKVLIAELEAKNRRLNDKLTQVIYNKAAAYKEKTLHALQRGDSPERRERIQAYGLQAAADCDQLSDRGKRPLKNSPSPLRHASPETNSKVYKELERLELSN